MAFEKNNFDVAKKMLLPKSELSVECNISAGTNVTKVLSLLVDARVESQEVLNGVINFSGILDTKLVFCGENDEINTICANCPFSSKFESEEIEAGQTARIAVTVIDCRVESVGGETVKVMALLEQKGTLVCNQQISTISCHDDNVCIKNEEIETIKFIGSASEDIVVESEINIRENIKKIILVESGVVVKNVESGVGFATISGDVVSRVLYLGENDKFESGYVYDGFKEEIELSSLTRDSLVEGEAVIGKMGATTEIVEEEKGCKLLVKVPLSITVRGYDRANVSVINDLYSVKGDIHVTTSSFNMSEVCPVELVEGKIEGTLTLDENEPRVDKLLFHGGSGVTITNAYIKEGEVTIEGIARTSAIYLNDETSSLHSVQLEIPFSLNDKIACDDGAIILVDAIVSDVDVVVKKGREFYYDARVKATVNCCHDLASGVISEAVMVGEGGEKDYAMEIIFAPAGRELWDIAKSAKVKEEQILVQNPEVIFPTSVDTPLVLFNQRIQ